MAYQTMNPNTEELIKSFPEHTDQQLEKIIVGTAVLLGFTMGLQNAIAQSEST